MEIFTILERVEDPRRDHLKKHGQNLLNVGFFRLMYDEESLTASLCSFFV